MAELLVRIVDKTNPGDAILDRQLTKRGDVIHVAPDGWVWGDKEIANTEWRIFAMPGVDPATLMDLLEIDYSAPDANGTMTLIRKRRKYLNIDSLSAPTLNLANKANIRATMNTSQVSEILATKTTKPAITQITV